MNFDFSDEQKQLRDEARKFLAEKCPPKAVRVVLDGKEPYDRGLWKGLADMGFLGVAIPEEFGGAGAGHLELCVIAEEIGRKLNIPHIETKYVPVTPQTRIPLIANGTVDLECGTTVNSLSRQEQVDFSYAVALAEGRSIEEALPFACAVAGLKVTKAGAGAGMPRRAEVEALLARGPQ